MGEGMGMCGRREEGAWGLGPNAFATSDLRGLRTPLTTHQRKKW